VSAAMTDGTDGTDGAAGATQRPTYRDSARRLFHVVGVLVLIAWLVTMWALVRKHSTGFGELSLGVTSADLDAGFREGFIYHGIYAGKGRAGTLYTEQRRLEDGGYSVRSRMDLALTVMGKAGNSKTDVEMRLDQGFRLKAFEAKLDGSGLSGSARGEWVEGKGLLVTLTLAGTEGQSQVLAMSEPPLVQHTLRAALVRKGMKPGERVSMQVFSPEALGEGSVSVDITFKGREELNLGGQTLEAFHFEEAIRGFVQQVYVNEVGEVLQEELPMGMLLVREAEAEAKGADLTPMEISLPKLLDLPLLPSMPATPPAPPAP
jgi:hypothetical protein